MKPLKRISALALTCSLGALNFTPSAVADNHDALKAKLEAAMAADIRTEAERERDRNRKPIETLSFFGLEDDMKVVELIPGGGWYTKLLAPVLADNGQLYVAFGTSRVESHLIGKPGFENVKVLGKDAVLGPAKDSPLYAASNTDLDVSNVDIIFTFRNYHNFDTASRANINKSVYKALKKGGIYALVDHTRRHMQETDNENRRRFDPVLAIKEIQDAGFELVDYSDLHYRADDELRFEVGRRSVAGNTDRWTLKFRKP